MKNRVLIGNTVEEYGVQGIYRGWQCSGTWGLVFRNMGRLNWGKISQISDVPVDEGSKFRNFAIFLSLYFPLQHGFLTVLDVGLDVPGFSLTSLAGTAWDE